MFRKAPGPTGSPATPPSNRSRPRGAPCCWSACANARWRDIRDLSHIDALSSLPRLLALIATRTAGLLNFMDLARGSGIPQTTLKRYFALLEATFLVQLVQAWTNNLGKRLIKAPKLYLNDTGLAAYLLGLN